MLFNLLTAIAIAIIIIIIIMIVIINNFNNHCNKSFVLSFAYYID